MEEEAGRGHLALSLLRKLHFRSGDNAGGWDRRQIVGCGWKMAPAEEHQSLNYKKKVIKPQQKGNVLVHLRPGVNHGRAAS